MRDVWILGAVGRTGTVIATSLAAAGVPVVLVGRDRPNLQHLADKIGGSSRVFVAASLKEIEAELRRVGPVVVVNLIGPFAATAVPIINACVPGSGYLDLSNERSATAEVLDLDKTAKETGCCLVSGAGWGVLAAESVVLKLCKDLPAVARVRVDLAPFVVTTGRVGETFAATIIDAMSVGAHIYKGGQLTRVGLGSYGETLIAPDGSKIRTGAASSGDLEVARRASGASFAVAGSIMAPTAPLARAMMSAILLLFKFRSVREFAKRYMANMVMPPSRKTPKPSWAHARVEWADGRVRDAWLRAGEGMAFTSGVAAEVALRLSRGEGRPGAFTPGQLFGPELAEAVGAKFFVSEG